MPIDCHPAALLASVIDALTDQRTPHTRWARMRPPLPPLRYVQLCSTCHAILSYSADAPVDSPDLLPLFPEVPC